eukprot:TRINITY_DN3333_c0_g1_i1.p1 TRINITY_DN3333_c0_g1~~TRINITY_DN3333_c0_g1_i1.p1  ORF type:complete len:206 (+),score=45.31 TRINITY_DN3333_c0_g1_i1:365-982(+)
MALTELTRRNIIKSIVSTNLDGLHYRSGTPISILSELHGNRYKRKCENCDALVYIDPKKVRELGGINASNDFRICSSCGGRLRGTGVGFGQDLPQHEYDIAIEAGRDCDLALVMGTSMRVSPACNMPETSYKNGGDLCIVNLQKTPYDKYARIASHCETDVFMRLVMGFLDIAVDEYSFDSETVVVDNKPGYDSECYLVGNGDDI